MACFERGCVKDNTIYWLYLIYAGIILVYLIILALAVYILVRGFICDDHQCHTFITALCHKTEKEIVLHLLDRLCEDSLWPIAFIASSIIMFLVIAILPIPLWMPYFTIIFLVSFTVFYCLIAFVVYHYVVPIKHYIKQFINTHADT